ncbi:MAG: serine/threonine protein kinase [Planctomycetes bacterium]|nr:serine/threonine protein kinase [Planctomycetota bacterium]
MGTVYLAQRVDGQFDQQVAIKVVKRGMDSEEILNRFSLERRTLASLNHPRIARLFDGGATDDGRPYLVMEYVKGDPIGQFCDERRLNIDARLLIFCNVCDAVGFAHQNLVVHRDLKPGNILVDDDREPKLLDFGISKVLVGTGSTEVTIADDRRYTPEYASPEHVLGESLSTAADIYSLGVILYELLSGRQPLRFTSRSAAEIERVVRNVIPSPPSETYSTGQKVDSTVSSGGQDVMCRASLRGESPNRFAPSTFWGLDTIVLKAMHKDPKRRYVSVEQFAADIRRHLQGLPVLARPDTVGYRLNKFVRRHRAAVILSIGASMFILGGAGVAFWQAGVARAERDAANLARDQAEATADFFQQMLAAADPF